MSDIKRKSSDRRSTMSTPATSHSKTNRETLTSTAPTALTSIPNPNPTPSQLLELPTLTDTLPQLAHKLSALAAVIQRGESIAAATGRSSTVTVAEHHSIPGASTLSLAEVAELQTCRKAIDTGTEVQARIRREMRLLTKEIHQCSEIIRGRLVSLQAKNPKSKHYGKHFRGWRSGSGRESGASNVAGLTAGAGDQARVGSQLSTGFNLESIPKAHRPSVADLLRGTGLKSVRDSTPTLEDNAANGEDVRLSPNPAQIHRSDHKGGQPSPEDHFGDREQPEKTGVLGKEEQPSGFTPSPELRKRQRVH